MAERGVHLEKDLFYCSICLELLKDPVTLPCGHNYCHGCIKNYWDVEDKIGIYTCPQCREAITPRPVLKKNNMLAEVIAQLRKTELRAVSPPPSSAGPADAECDFCTEGRKKASMFCLVCLAFYCETHIEPHYNVAPLKKHRLVKATPQLENNICFHHNKLKDVFCRTDQQCICYLCSVEEHQGHTTVSAVTESTEKRKELGWSREMMQQKIQESEKDLKVLQQEEEAINSATDKVVDDVKKIFTELAMSFERRCYEIEKFVRVKQKAAMDPKAELRVKLTQRISDLRRKDTDLEQISKTDNHVIFLQDYTSFSSASQSTDVSNTDVHLSPNFQDIATKVRELRDQLESNLREYWSKIVDFELQPKDPKTENDCFKYYQRITLDQNTAHNRLLLSNGNRKAQLLTSTQQQQYPKHPERFLERWQVLSQEGLTGRCYWEVERKGRADIAVAYKDIRRTGTRDDCGFGRNDKSWALLCRQDTYIFKHNNVETEVTGCQSSHIGVYLDHKAGILSFYTVSDKKALLHTANATFTQPLFAGFWFPQGAGSSAELCDLMSD